MNELYQQLEGVIENHYGAMTKNEVLEFSQEFCNHFMIQTNSLLQKNLHTWSDTKVRDYALRVQVDNPEHVDPPNPSIKSIEKSRNY